VVDTDGSQPSRVPIPGDAIGGAWSPDGKRIAFTRQLGLEVIPERKVPTPNIEIYTARADGTDVVRLTDQPGIDAHPTWSPDGRRIAFASDRGGSEWHIYVMDADGSNVIQLAEGQTPAWSPDGSHIAFTGRGDTSGAYVLLMDPDGANVVPLAPGYEPAWSPDGTRIAFARRGIFTMRTDGTEVVQVVGDSDTTPTPHTPAWSPDGTKIAFACVIDAGEIFVVDTDGSHLIRLTDDTVNDAYPAWVPS